MLDKGLEKRMKTRHFFRVFWFLMSSLSLTGCFQKKLDPNLLPPQNEILIGEFGTFSSSAKESHELFGLPTHEGIELAISEKNSAGGIRGKKIRLIQADTRGEKEQTITAVTKLITQDKVHVLLGEVFSDLSLAAAPVAQSYQVPMVSPASTHPQITDIGNYIFRSCFVESFQGSVMAQFARDHLGLKKAIILRDRENQYSHTLANFFASDFKKLGGKILLDLTYSMKETDWGSLWKQISQQKTDLVFIPSYAKEVKQIVQSAHRLSSSITFLGGDGWDGIDIPEEKGKAFPSAFFSNHFSAEDKNEKAQDFVKKFEAAYGKSPGALAALGYDAAQIVFGALEKSQSFERGEIRKLLAETRNFEGATGIISFNKDRNAIKPAVILRVQPSKHFSYRATLNP